MVKYYLIILVVLFVGGCATTNKYSKPDKFNFGFEEIFSNNKNIDNWQLSGCRHTIQLDSFVTQQGAYSGKVTVYASPYPEEKNLTISQLFYLPSEAEMVNLSIWMKTISNGKATLKTTLLNANETILKSQIQNFNIVNEWGNCNMKLNTKLVRLINVEIILDQNSLVWLDGFQLEIDGKPFEKMNPKKLNTPQLKLDYVSKIDLSSSIDHEVISTFSNKKVIGIAESVHGVHELAIGRNQLIKALVENENCRLVIFEAPDAYVEELNSYVQGEFEGNEVFKAKDSRRAQYYIFTNEMFELLTWLREYNKTATKKVVVAGMDVSNEWEEKFRIILNQHNTQSIIKELIELFSKRDIEQLKQKIEENQGQLSALLKQEGYDKLLSSITKHYRYHIVYRSATNYRGRDSIMAVNAKELVEKYTNGSEKAIVCGHISHLNKVGYPNSLTPSTGKWLNDYYGNNYFVIAQLVGNGEYQANLTNTEKWNLQPLDAPAKGSLEHVCSGLQQADFYALLPTSTDGENRLLTIRQLGGVHLQNQFFSGNVNRRFDALMFVKEGTPLHLILNDLR